MSNRNDIFIKLEKNRKGLESYAGFPLVFIMKDKVPEKTSHWEMYIGMLDCIEGEKIYLTDAYAIDDNASMYFGDEFKKWDLSREDPTFDDFSCIELESVDSVYASKLKLTLEQTWNAWSDPRDLLKTQTYQKILDKFNEIKKTFTEESEPIFFNQSGEKLTLKEIHEIESVEGKPISMIAVTRHQYDTNNFPKYENYVISGGFSRFYYGFWPDKNEKKTEWDVLYAIPTNDPKELQHHLNAHNHMNQGIAQVMALIISSDGATKIVRNSI